MLAGEAIMKSLIVKRSVVIAGRRTSVSLEDEFWNCLREISNRRSETLTHLIASIDKDRRRHRGNLSSAIRLFVLSFYRNQPDPQGGTRVRLAA
jgi:predicted DNA-binding ribbon-helix-helix protein